ncbi:hypothetical protein [Deinococcus radiophilus]|uniref:Uncharacterized protein n=1 Tax=Deinococcus radiophilus TaxID=32062 RepID=A0A431W5R0_9DEIO|nr:hypothetical protein [Deinococcus radiophilus]RTR30809.1 hypothetical protein EJ104_00725 [Deinococcus radiophilus]UFA49392.1 hypothetical protein LMT64_05595 [Deinococcus radiophilus]
MVRSESDLPGSERNCPTCLSILLRESSFDPWESVEGAYQRTLSCGVDTPGHALALTRLAHIQSTKREYWATIAGVRGLPVTPTRQLRDLLTWELDTLSRLSVEQLDHPLTHAGRSFSVGAPLPSLRRLWNNRGSPELVTLF